jgi:hypothetical protein
VIAASPMAIGTRAITHLIVRRMVHSFRLAFIVTAPAKAVIMVNADSCQRIRTSMVSDTRLTQAEMIEHKVASGAISG